MQCAQSLSAELHGAVRLGLGVTVSADCISIYLGKMLEKETNLCQ